MLSSWVLLVLILIYLLPVVIVYIWFRLAKYQISLIQFLFAFLAGAAAFFPALVLQNLLTFKFISHGRLALFYNFFIRISLTEELSRFIMLFIFFFIGFLIKPPAKGSQPSNFNVIKLGTALGLVAGFGFAILESARYAADGMSINIALLRIFTAALHGACSSRVGSAIILLRKKPSQAITRFLTAVAIHGVYNLMVYTQSLLPSIAAVLITLSALITTILSIRGGWESVSISLDKSEENQ
jgi:RsiW-degrading membrane proteinase PrsW (M82 family)